MTDLHLAVKPQRAFYLQIASPAIGRKGQQKFHRLHVVSRILQQSILISQQLTGRSQVLLLHMAEAAGNNAAAAGSAAAGEVILLQQEGPSPGTGTLTSNSNTIGAAANDDHLKAFVFQRPAIWRQGSHS